MCTLYKDSMPVLVSPYSQKVNTDIKSYISQRYANGSCPTAHIQHGAVLVQLSPLPHGRVQQLSSSCINLHMKTQRFSTLVNICQKTELKIMEDSFRSTKLLHFLTWKKEWGDILNFRPSSSSWIQLSPATSSQGKSSRLGDVLHKWKQHLHLA